MLATLFVPAVVLLVPLYLTILHPPLIGTSLINTFWAVWLPAGASAFNVLLVTRFFDNLPREIFEAARTDGAGTFRLFWSIVLPMSQSDPRSGVDPRDQRGVGRLPVAEPGADGHQHPDRCRFDCRRSRARPISASTSAALTIATLIPVVIFLIFQRAFLNGGGIGGAVKG